MCETKPMLQMTEINGPRFILFLPLFTQGIVSERSED